MNRVFQRGIKLSSICKGVGDKDWDYIAPLKYKTKSSCRFEPSKVEVDPSSIVRAKKLIQLDQKGNVFHSEPLSSFMTNLQPGFDCSSLISAQAVAVARGMLEDGETQKVVHSRFTGIVDPTLPIEYSLRYHPSTSDRESDCLRIRGVQNGEEVINVSVNNRANYGFDQYRMPRIYPNSSLTGVSPDNLEVNSCGNSSNSEKKEVVSHQQVKKYRKYTGWIGLIDYHETEPIAWINNWNCLPNVQDAAKTLMRALDEGTDTSLSVDMANRIKAHIKNNMAENSLFEVRPDNIHNHYMWVSRPKKHFPIYQWIRFKGEILDDDALLQRILLMYSVNMPSYETVAKPHFWGMKEELYTSYQHFEMFRPLTKNDKWLLLGTHSSPGKKRGCQKYASRIWSQDGELIAECRAFKVPKNVITMTIEELMKNGFMWNIQDPILPSSDNVKLIN